MPHPHYDLCSLRLSEARIPQVQGPEAETPRASVPQATTSQLDEAHHVINGVHQQPQEISSTAITQTKVDTLE